MLRRLSGTQITYIFRALGLLAAVGAVLLVLQALVQLSWSASLLYLFIGGLATIIGIGIGGLLGLVFGLPQSVLVTPVASADKGTAPPANASGDWYNDSSTLEKIAGAATAAIIALSLANYEKIADRFDHAALAVGTAMQASAGTALDTALTKAADALAATKVTKAAAETTEAYDARRKASASALILAQANVDRAMSNAEVPGALLLGGYAVLGFAAAYLWTRRFLPAELANARRAQRDVVRQDAEDAAALGKARANKLEQATPKADTDPTLASDAVAKAEDPASSVRSFAADVAFVQPGNVQDDPWKGQFRGKASSDTAEIVASVREMSSPKGMFFVSLAIRGHDEASCKALAGKTARLYLHPSFPNPIIRPLTFNAEGTIELTLAAVGAFTVGVQILPSNELLELDLASLRDAPAAFRLN